MGDDRKDPITVLHIFSGDLWAGAEVMIFNLLDRLKDDPDLRIVALSLNDGILTHKLRSRNIEVYVIPESVHSFSRIWLDGLGCLRGKKIHIIHSHRYKENLLALLLARARGIKRLVTTVHGLSESPVRTQTDLGSRMKTKIDYFVLTHGFDRVVAVSQEMRRALIQEYGFHPERVEVIYNGIALRGASPSSSRSGSDDVHIGTVSRMVPVKDLDLFLDVAAEIKRRTDKVRFSILGDGPQKQRLIQRAKDLQLEERIEFVSPIPDPLPYYESLDLYLNTSLHEGIPLSILEAMACGKPVVAPSVGGLPEIISHGEHGLVVHGREPSDFADACLKILQDGKVRTLMGESASKRIADRFSSAQMAESYRRSYVQLWQTS